METDGYLERIRIVLVDTQDGANIGSVCRAMKTMGITDLAIVGDRKYDEDRVRTLALHASDVWENAKRFPTLSEALSDSIFTVGATRRRGKFRKLSAYSPEQLSEKVSALPEGRISIVFGRESDGLRDDEVQQCAAIVTIPTSDAFPSLNLSQAVQIICYVLFNSALVYKQGMVPVSHEKARESAEEISSHLQKMGYYKLADEEKWTQQLIGDIIERAALSGEELRRFEKIFRKAELIALHKKDNS
ncbi:MAG: RNA methyltransferase [Spirochaetes bacterium]|uniref:tRNA (cytidine/uridine-2'-O-)-methyltransferase TrmJ n=1 Tax=Candidatus Ornithospirochaeta stercoripullorum TaxID=2840899 RepID=A0A9D9H4C5_9SPIO|nr:RNA methyltransferase [Candidatus Ornithospirochaeta stercoripullorum]